jgi:hypothetical protein
MIKDSMHQEDKAIWTNMYWTQQHWQNWNEKRRPKQQ